MRRRVPLVLRGMGLALSVFSVGFAVNFFFDDGDLNHKLPRLEASAQAREASEEEVLSFAPGITQMTPCDQEACRFFLPKGFTPQWQTVSLDHGQVVLQTLKRKFTLEQTDKQLGSNYFDYSATLFQQASQQIQEKRLAEKLEKLSVQAQNLGYFIREAGEWKYDGPPTSELGHLQARSAILENLEHIHGDIILTDERNALTGAHIAKAAVQEDKQRAKSLQAQAGPDFQNFLELEQQILQDPDAIRYPETMKIVQAETELLKALASHTALHWESRVYQHKNHPNQAIATHFQVYAEQTLPKEKIRLSF